MTVALVACGLAFWLLAILFVVALCQAAASGDGSGMRNPPRVPGPSRAAVVRLRSSTPERRNPHARRSSNAGGGSSL